MIRQAAADFTTALDRLTTKIDDVVNRHPNFYASNKLNTKMLHHLEANGFPAHACSMLKHNFEVLRKELDAAKLTPHRDNLEVFLGKVYTVALITDISAVNVRSATPDTPAKLKKQFFLLSELSQHSYQKTCLELEDKFVKQPVLALKGQTPQVVESLGLDALEEGEDITYAVNSSGSLGRKAAWLKSSGFDKSLVDWVYDPHFEDIFGGWEAQTHLQKRTDFERLIVDTAQRLGKECGQDDLFKRRQNLKAVIDGWLQSDATLGNVDEAVLREYKEQESTKQYRYSGVAADNDVKFSEILGR
jgi:hypothetical protein